MAAVDLSKLKPGLEGHAEIVVGEQHTAPRIGSGRVRVLATPVMINLMEAAALDAVENLIPAGHQSLGTRLDVRHIAATPVGMRVRATAKGQKLLAAGRMRRVAKLAGAMEALGSDDRDTVIRATAIIEAMLRG